VSTTEALINSLPGLIAAIAGSGAGVGILKLLEHRHKANLERDKYESTQAERYAEALSKSKDDLLDWLRLQIEDKNNQIEDKNKEILRHADQLKILEARLIALQAHVESVNNERRNDEDRHEQRAKELDDENRALRNALMKMHRSTGRRVTGMTDILNRIENPQDF
jgi:hypothetical protein